MKTHVWLLISIFLVYQVFAREHPVPLENQSDFGCTMPFDEADWVYVKGAKTVTREVEGILPHDGSPGWWLIQSERSEYSREGKLLTRTSIAFGGSKFVETYRYLSPTQTKKTTTFDGEVTGYTTYNYDVEGRLVEYLEFDELGRLEYRRVNTYDESRRISEASISHGKGETTFSVSCRYEGDSRITEIVKNLKENTDTVYSYAINRDGYGRWIVTSISDAEQNKEEIIYIYSASGFLREISTRIKKEVTISKNGSISSFKTLWWLDDAWKTESIVKYAYIFWN